MAVSLGSRLHRVEPWLPGGRLAECFQVTTDGSQLLCESLIAGAKDERDPMVATIALDVDTHVITVLRSNSAAEASDVDTGADSDSSWIVWAQDHDGPDNTAAFDWTIYAFNRATQQLHVVSRATLADVSRRTATVELKPRLANGRVWWAATVTDSTGAKCTCTYSAAAAGGVPRLEAVDTLYPQPVPGAGSGPEGTTVYSERPDEAATGALGARISAAGQAQVMSAGDEVISAIAAGKAGVAWERAEQQVVISYSPPAEGATKIIGSLAVQPSDNPAELGADELAVGDRYVVWSESDGGRLYDTQTDVLYQVTAYDYPIINTSGSAVMWGVALAKKDMKVDDQLALLYYVLS